MFFNSYVFWREILIPNVTNKIIIDITRYIKTYLTKKMRPYNISFRLSTFES